MDVRGAVRQAREPGREDDLDPDRSASLGLAGLGYAAAASDSDDWAWLEQPDASSG